MKEAIGSVPPCCSRYLSVRVTHGRMELHVSEEQSSGGNCDTPQALSSAKCCKIPVLAGSLGKGVSSFQHVLCIPADKMLPSEFTFRNTSSPTGPFQAQVTQPIAALLLSV